jgi:hypothetical protein
MEVPVVNLYDGTAMTDDQRAVYVDFVLTVQATMKTGEAQQKSKKHQEEIDAACKALHSEGETGNWLRSWLSPVCQRRYIVANNWSVPNAYEALLRSVWWRCQNVPVIVPPVSAHQACVNTRYMEWVSFDREGRPNLFIKSRNADLDISREDRTRFMIYMMEKGVSLMKERYSGRAGVERWNIIIDEKSKEWKHMDNSFLSTVTPVVFANYVEHLNRAYVLNPGTLTSMAISAIKLFVDDRTKAKMVTMHTKKQPDGTRLALELIEQLGAENVPVAYGGALPDESAEDYQRRLATIL